MPTIRPLVRDQRGFSMITVMVVMLVTGLFVTAAFAAADGDLPLGKRSQDSKEAYAAAEAGLSFYESHLAQDNRYWTHCTNVPPPNATEPSPVVNKWYGTGIDTRTNHWRTVAGTNNQYAIELLPATVPTGANPTPQCVEGDESTMLDPSTGMFRIRVTGKSNGVKRSIVASFRRKGLLDFLWLTNYETQDPNNYPPNGYVGASYQTPDWAADNCTDVRGARSTNCQDQQFASADRLLGPFHTNDTSILTCDGSTFGRAGKHDRIEVTGPNPGWDNQCGSSAPNFQPGPLLTGQATVDLPPSNTALATTAAAGGRVFTGVTKIRLNGNQMSLDGGSTWQALPANGVIYVKNGATGCTEQPPILADYAESTSCGNVYVSGTYSGNLTIAAQNDIIIAPTNITNAANPPGNNDASLKRATGSTGVLGLIAENFVRIAHRVTPSPRTDPDTCTNVNSTAYPNIGNVTVQAAILSVQHSFTVDNYGCGSAEGNLTVIGAIAQNFRGTVGKVNGPGYIKDYNYDDLLKFRSPPYFLSPLATPWLVARENEQIPAT
jgi:Tfp pilus assembly protein PilE